MVPMMRFSVRNGMTRHIGGDVFGLQVKNEQVTLQWDKLQLSDCSSNGVYTVASHWASDLSTFSSLRDSSFYQHTFTNAPPSETNVQYVTFITTDGDNVQWNIGDMAGYFTNAAWNLPFQLKLIVTLFQPSMIPQQAAF